MSRAELLAKMTARGAAITGAAFGGTISISALDVAGALGMGKLPRPSYLFGLLKYCGDHQAMGSLCRIMEHEVAALSKGNRWELTARQVSALAQAAIMECLQDPVCEACNGSGTVAAKSCGPCLGSGRVPMSNRQRALYAGVPETTWRRELKDKAPKCVQVVKAWEQDLMIHLDRQFGRLSGLTEEEKRLLQSGA